MGELIKFPEQEEETILVCCAECGEDKFSPLLYKGVLFLQCVNEDCGEVYEIAEMEEAEIDGV